MVAVVFAFWIVATAGPPVEAHAFLVQTAPIAGERLAVAPAAVQLRFSEPVVSAELRVTKGHEVAVPHKTARHSQGGLLVEAALPPLADGAYVVTYEVAANDGHITAGEFAFGVGDVDEFGTAAASGADGAEADIPWFQALARWTLLAGLLIAVGGLASERFVWRRVASTGGVLPRMPIQWLAVLAAAGACGSLLALVLGPLAAGNAAGVQDRLLSRPTIALIAQLALLASAAPLLPVPRLRSRALVPLGGALALATLGGHPAGQGIGVAAVNLVHVFAVALWIGGLLHVALVLWRVRGATDAEVIRRGVVRYTTAALAVVAVVVLTGALVAFVQFRRPADLIDTAYGRFMLAKLAFVAAALGLALLARLRGLGRSGVLRVPLLARISRIEALALVAAFGLASVVASIAPPDAIRGATYLLGPPPLEGPVARTADLAGSMAVHVGAAPGRLQVRALAPSGDGALDATLGITGRRPDGTRFDVQPRECGPGCWTSALAWPAGTTILIVELASEQWGNGALDFEVAWPPAPESPERLEAVIEAMRDQEFVVLTERVSSGPGATAGPLTFRLRGEEFVELEPFASGGATDVRPVPATIGTQALTLFLAGSSIWFRLELDEHDRIVAETIVSTGHLIERSFSYPVEAPS